jgi:hypothetical protein
MSVFAAENFNLVTKPHNRNWTCVREGPGDVRDCTSTVGTELQRFLRDYPGSCVHVKLTKQYVFSVEVEVAVGVWYSAYSAGTHGSLVKLKPTPNKSCSR